MDRTALQDPQRPLKERYRADPGACCVVLQTIAAAPEPSVTGARA